MQRVAICKTDLLYGELPVFYFNSNNKMYEHFYANGKHRLFYDEDYVESDDKWIVFEIDRENHQYSKIRGNF